MDGYRIGQLAETTDISTETIRYYEKIGLLPQPIRHPNGYRIYKHESMRRLKFISRAKSVGFTLNEISMLLSLNLSSKNKCSETEAQCREKIAVIDSKLHELVEIRRALELLVEHCAKTTNDGNACPILEYFETGEEIK